MTQDHSRRLAAILASDVVGYSRLMRADEEAAFSAVRHLRDNIFQPAAAGRSGRLFKTMGDGFLLEFPSVIDAMHCALAIQKDLADWNAGAPASHPVELRMGLNVGDVIAQGDDLFGDAVNIAARLEAMADPGGICLSEAALQQLKDRMALEIEDMGERALKNIDTPIHAFRVRSATTPRPGASQSNPTAEPQRYTLGQNRPSLAILPFRNIGASPDGAFISQGISLGIQTLLVQLPNMFLVNACNHADYRDGIATAAQALAHMPVRYAVEGSVQHAGNQVRVTTQVTDLKENAVKWASHYDRALDDIFALQDEIARSIAGALSVELIGGHLAHDFTGDLDSPGAWEHFLRGINFFYRMTKSDHAQAIPHFEALATAHPESAIGPCYLSVLHYYAARRGWHHDPRHALAEAEKWARLAVPLEDGNNGLGHAVLGAIALEQHQHDEAKRLSHAAVGFRASCPFAHYQLGITQTYTGEVESGIRNIRNAIALRMAGPLPLELNALAVAYRDRGDLDLSITAAEEATKMAPEFLDAFVTLTSDFALSGETEKARQTSQAILLSQPGFQIAEFVERQPYQSADMRLRIADALRTAGLPG